MFIRVSSVVVLGVLMVAGTVFAEDAKAYKGTFKDDDGHKGPMKCQLASKEAGKWNLVFTGKNEGKGPHKEYEYKAELSGKEEGGNLSITGEIDAKRQGVYTITITVAGESLKATFKKKAGGGDGSIDLAIDKGEKVEAPAAKTEAKPETKTEEPKAKE